MSYQRRNFFVLLALVLIVSLVSAYFLLFHYPRKVRQVEKKIKQTKKEIAALDGIEKQYEMVVQLIAQKEKKIAQNDKQISVEVTPAQSYDYLNRIIQYSGIVDFDLYFAGKQKTKAYGYNIYQIKGESYFSNLFRFIWYIERGPQIYKIKKLVMRGVENIDPEEGYFQLLIPFEMELWALYADLPDLPKVKRSLGDVRVVKAHNMFYPYLRSNLPPNVDGLVEAERAELRAIVSGKALIADHNGNVHMLKEGDRVYLGYVSKIDPAANEVEFTLNKGGIVERFVLKMQFGNQKREKIR